MNRYRLKILVNFTIFYYQEFNGISEDVADVHVLVYRLCELAFWKRYQEK